MSAPDNIGRIVAVNCLGKDEKELLQQALLGAANSYSPYSKFAVGAALKCNDGTIYTGCNIENAAYSPGICAERTALAKAVSDGHRRFSALAVIANQTTGYTAPCGVCRQTISEFALDIPVYLGKPSMEEALITTMKELLPLAFSMSNNN